MLISQKRGTISVAHGTCGKAWLLTSLPPLLPPVQHIFEADPSVLYVSLHRYDK
jgi:hypothetical protein